MTDSKACPLCDNAGAEIKEERHGCRIECPTCGPYAIGRIAASAISENSELREARYRLSAVAYESALRGSKLFLLSGGAWADMAGFESVQIKEVVQTRFPRLLSDRFDRALLNLARLSRHFGQLLEPPDGQGNPLLFAQNGDEAHFIVRALMAEGYISGQSYRDGFTVQLTPEGWSRVEELRAGRTGEQLTQAFVAMWFGNAKDPVAGRLSAEFCSEAFLVGFKPAAEKAGYSARRIDFKEFNDDIMDEIIAKIRRSKFVVADFTGHRAGVYDEAGFARGLGIPVIFTCHKDHVASAHFDTSHMNHLTWSSFDELAQRLERRIVATIGQGPLAPSSTDGAVQR